jgi:hypothetical protein
MKSEDTRKDRKKIIGKRIEERRRRKKRNKGIEENVR